MTPIELVKSVASFLEQTVNEYSLETKTGETKTPQVFCGETPIKDKENEKSIYPFLLVRFDSEEITSDDKVSVMVEVGTYSEDEQNGWMDPLNIATRIKIALKKKGFIGPFSLNRIKIESVVEDFRPYWFVVMELQFNIPDVQPEWGDF